MLQLLIPTADLASTAIHRSDCGAKEQHEGDEERRCLCGVASLLLPLVLGYSLPRPQGLVPGARPSGLTCPVSLWQVLLMDAEGRKSSAAQSGSLEEVGQELVHDDLVAAEVRPLSLSLH